MNKREVRALVEEAEADDISGAEEELLGWDINDSSSDGPASASLTSTLKPRTLRRRTRTSTRNSRRSKRRSLSSKRSSTRNSTANFYHFFQNLKPTNLCLTSVPHCLASSKC